MNKYLIVKAGKVVNTVVWDGISEWSPPEGTTAVVAPEGVGIGWTQVGTSWVAPEPSTTPVENPHRVAAVNKLSALGLTSEEIEALLQ